MTRTYADAIASLNTLQSNFAIIDAIRKSGRKKNEQAIPEMIEWCRKIGYEPTELNRLNAIHIAGTKGKGSTAAFTSSILTQYLADSSSERVEKTLSKVGLYTSPHLRFVRERIQINGKPLTEAQFTRYFFEIWDRLEKAAEAEGSDPKAAGSKPVYFRFLTLMAFHAYMTEGVDAAIIECGIGGAYDSTNILENPVVTGITTLGIDHVGVLGATLPEIAWHKAGIMKNGSKCFTPSSQQSDTKPVLEQVANEKASGLIYTDIEPKIASGETKLGLAAEFQKTNASLAAAIAREWLEKQAFEVNEDLISNGLQATRLAGRCDTRQENNITWCIDGGHTLESIEVAAKWFASVLQSSNSETAAKTYRHRYLIFNQQTRDASALAHALHKTLVTTLSSELSNASSSSAQTTLAQPFTHAIFCTNTTYKSTGYRPDLIAVNTNSADVEVLKVQKELAETWKGIDPGCTVSVVKTIEEAIDIVRADATTTDQDKLIGLVTGSLHLVGGFLEVFEGADEAS